jgi:GDP-4-dehydro-6-deoxy-D-mannose reductase
MDRPILITGAAGFAGSHLLDLLEGGPEPVVAWRRPSDPLPYGRTGHENRWMSLDLLDCRAVERAMVEVGPAAIYHCAGAAHVGQSWDRTCETLAANVLGTHHLIAAVRRCGLSSRILIPGSAYVYRQSDRAITEEDAIGPASPYALSKLAQEMVGTRAVVEDGLPVLLTRSFNHVGPRQHPSFSASSFARQIATIEAGRTEPVLRVGNLDARRDLTDVRDTMRAYRMIVERGRPGIPYNVCSGRAYAAREMLDMLLAHARAEIRVEVDPSRYRPNDMPLVLGDLRRIRNELAWTPVIPLEQTMSDLLEYWRQVVNEE